MWASGRGVRYGDRRLRTAANTERALNRRLSSRQRRTDAPFVAEGRNAEHLERGETGPGISEE
jgi:hypothetical protein